MLALAGEAVILAGQFTESKLGKTGLTVTIDVYRVALSDLTTTPVVTGGAATAIGGGIYAYRHVTTTPGAYYYFGVLKTATTTVDLREVPALQIAGITPIENVPAIKAKTDNLPSDPADASDIATLVDALPTAAEVVAALKADTEWKKMLASTVTGNFTFTPPPDGGGTATLVLSYSGGTVTHTLTVDADGAVTARVVS